MISMSEKDTNSQRLITEAEARTGLNKKVIKVRCSDVSSRTRAFNFYRTGLETTNVQRSMTL